MEAFTLYVYPRLSCYQMRSEEELVFSIMISSIVVGHTDGLPPTFLKVPTPIVPVGQAYHLLFAQVVQPMQPLLPLVGHKIHPKGHIQGYIHSQFIVRAGFIFLYGRLSCPKDRNNSIKRKWNQQFIFDITSSGNNCMVIDSQLFSQEFQGIINLDIIQS